MERETIVQHPVSIYPHGNSLIILNVKQWVHEVNVGLDVRQVVLVARQHAVCRKSVTQTTRQIKQTKVWLISLLRTSESDASPSTRAMLAGPNRWAILALGPCCA